ncbi:MCE family protein [Labedaea rhizosphaerae]|uniref:Phospholipid/cholesterol/gamma-HCH transport system substrate-binding protein n=1 Tax=Labedaea rhizosphaerae TaxID=598644 RepID=A0A4R6SR05_LABRH|nr:MCE family protein [Labedaea rhizosphaerae]TDQ05713.1 phospholipid/cholesterol/gamma-HCH transport system substrate-binding protein [Labedaea rhizosphaerae]
MGLRDRLRLGNGLRLGKRRGISAAAIASATALLVSGCGFSGIYDLPLPGGADLGDRPYTVKVELRDALDLVPQAGVKVNEVQVGRVDTIGVGKDGWTAEVTVLVNGDVQLPANAVANLRQSSLLGEKYIELSPPADARPQGKLADGAVIGLDRTNRNTEVEEVLGALSMLLNGGGIEQLQTIAKELNNALDGNEPQLRATLTNINTLVTGLDAHRDDITKALDSLSTLSGTLDQQKTKLAGAIEHLGPGLQVLAEQRGQLVTMLKSLDELSGVAVETLNKSQADLVADLKALRPTLQKLAEAGNNLPKALELMFTFPFTDAAIDGVKGDYVNLYLDLDLNLQDVIDNYGRARTNPLDGLPLLGTPLDGKTGTNPNYSPLPLPGDKGSSGGGATQPSSTSGLGSIFGTLLGGGA